MNVLVVGGGGREHAIVRKIKQSPHCTEIWAAPGNGGIAFDAKCKNIDATNVDALVIFAKEKQFDYVVVAPDDPLALGMVDKLAEAGIPAFGPTAAAARIESSKVFSKNLMKKYRIPTAAYEVFTQANAAMAYIRAQGKYPVVVKADGLALGKGVLICENEQQAQQAVSQMLEQKAFGTSGSRIVVEEFLTGPEVSVLAFADGKTLKPMVSSMDHKRALNDDKGLNTGGMGTIAPNPFYTPEIAELCMKTIFEPTMKAMEAEGCPFKGCLYFGLMLTPNGPRVIEYNCRFGDPETQVVLPLLESDLLEIMQACTNGTLAQTEVVFKKESAACVVLASGGYPQSYEKGKIIKGLRNGQLLNDQAVVYHAGTAQQGNKLVTSGGRVLGVTATAPSLEQAVQRAYVASDKIYFDKLHKRTDIGSRALRAVKGEQNMVYRIYVEKKQGFDFEAQNLLHEIHSLLNISSVVGVRLLNRYDVEGVSEDLFRQAIPTVFSEPPVDNTYEHCPHGDVVFAVEYLPGQFDQRADSASQCIQLMSQGKRPAVRTARVYLLQGNPTTEELAQIKKYVINPVEAREADLDCKQTLKMEYERPAAVEVLHGFRELDEEELNAFIQQKGLAMDLADIKFCQQYFKDEERDPTITEIRMIDTYWSDHCRHTTFGTILDEVEIQDVQVQKAFDYYLAMRKAVYDGRKKSMCLMDIATIGARYLESIGKLKNLDKSDEINACTVKIKCDVDGEEQDWLYLFKNETHNHPTEIEPFGGAATCIGGAIRDPLSGRSYVYQAMRVTGAGNPLVPVSETLPGKLPQRKIVTTAAAGYSSYGNQIGLATGQVDELYHPGYVAKRMEIGAVVGAAPAANVRREVPQPGDIVVLLGGATGRDGCGGATGSSKAHKLESLETCGAEVQKGNAPIERELQRLFRRPEATRLIKRCNDFGAGGVSVAIGELADGLAIDLDAVPKKYEGLDGTELAISESQERMAVVLAPEDVEQFIALAQQENLMATVVATVTEDPRLTMTWQGDTIVNISRTFLNSNGATKRTKVLVYDCQDYQVEWEGATWAEKLNNLVSDLNVCSKKGLSERFDSTIGAATVLMPFGGKYQLTPAQAMVAKLPVSGETTTCSGMAWGYNPWLMEKKQYSGAYLAVVESVSKLVASGFRYQDAYLTFQEYFERLGNSPERWGKPFAALLGALMAQVDLGIAAIGGKDSMSGSFENLNVPPTLVSFATAIGNTKRIISPEFKTAGNKVVWLRPEYQDLRPDHRSLKKVFAQVQQLIEEGKVKAAYTPGYGCAAEGLFKMCLGNRLGFCLHKDAQPEMLFKPSYGSFLLEVSPEVEAGELLGYVIEEYTFKIAGETVDMATLQEAWEDKLEPVFPYRKAGETLEKIHFEEPNRKAPAIGIVKPKVIIPVFPGTNCEYDTARAFARAGAEPEILVINNLTPANVTESCKALTQAIKRSQIVMLPGGFSGGDEPDGSAKFIAAFFRAPSVTEAVHELLQKRDGLMLGICNGFQALIKLGLVPYGEIRPITEECPTLTFNTIGRHQSMLVDTRIASNKSPWLSRCKVDEVHTIAISHGEGRFVASEDVVRRLLEQGQIATQYVDKAGLPTMDQRYNPNGSLLAVEGITSPDGRVLGKMGHTERSGNDLYQNVPGNKYQPLFEGGVDYFKL